MQYSTPHCFSSNWIEWSQWRTFDGWIEIDPCIVCNIPRWWFFVESSGTMHLWNILWSSYFLPNFDGQKLKRPFLGYHHFLYLRGSCHNHYRILFESRLSHIIHRLTCNLQYHNDFVRYLKFIGPVNVFDGHNHS